MTNDACRGYVILAMKELQFKKEDIEKVIDELHYQFDTVTEREAEQLYYNPFKYESKEYISKMEKGIEEEK